jgi:hypothetical protein
MSQSSDDPECTFKPILISQNLRRSTNNPPEVKNAE